MITNFSIYSIKIFEDISSFPYKDGDIVLIDKESIKPFYGSPQVDSFLDSIYHIQKIYLDRKWLDHEFKSHHPCYYFLNKKLRKDGRFAITTDHIIRLATPEEVKDFEIWEEASMFNL